MVKLKFELAEPGIYEVIEMEDGEPIIVGYLRFEDGEWWLSVGEPSWQFEMKDLVAIAEFASTAARP